MTIVANLDAAIEEHYAQTGETTREIQIFGRVWPLIREMTTVTLDPLAKMQAAAQIANDPARQTMQDQMMAVQMLTQVNEVLAMIVHEDVREEFRGVISTKGIPLPIIPQVIEAIMMAFDAAPFLSGASTGTEAPKHPTNTPLLVSTSASGSSPETPGFTSSPASAPQPTPTQPATQQPVPQPVVPGLSVTQEPQPVIQPYEPQMPPAPPSLVQEQ